MSFTCGLACFSAGGKGGTHGLCPDLSCEHSISHSLPTLLYVWLAARLSPRMLFVEVAKEDEIPEGERKVQEDPIIFLENVGGNVGLERKLAAFREK